MAKDFPVPPVINGEYEQVPVSELRFHPRNVNQGDLGAIITSIQANGFYGAVVCQRSTRYVVAGNHRLQAAKELGLPSVPVIWLECDNDSALRLLLADNRTARLGSDNPAKLAELLAEMQNETGLLGTAYSPEDLQALLDDLAAPYDGAAVTEKDESVLDTGKKSPQNKLICPDCGCKFVSD